MRERKVEREEVVAGVPDVNGEDARCREAHVVTHYQGATHPWTR